MFGIISALGAASSWTYACYLWRQQTKYFSAAQINIIKNIIAFIIFSPVILTFDFQTSFKEILILFLSGIIGDKTKYDCSFFIIDKYLLKNRLVRSRWKIFGFLNMSHFRNSLDNDKYMNILKGNIILNGYNFNHISKFCVVKL